jgi:hypothetical protein
MKGKIAQRYYYDRVPEDLREAMDEFYRLTGRRHEFVEPYRLDDADYAIVGMGSITETAMVVADYARDHMGINVGVLNITSFRPFPGPQIVEALSRLKAFSVVERLDIPLGQSNPLTTEIKAAFADAMVGAAGYPGIDRIPRIFSGAADAWPSGHSARGSAVLGNRWGRRRKCGERWLESWLCTGPPRARPPGSPQPSRWRRGPMATPRSCWMWRRCQPASGWRASGAWSSAPPCTWAGTTAPSWTS